VAQVDGEVRDPHLVSQRSRLGHRRGRAAAALGVVLGVGPQLQGHRDGLTLARAEVRGHGAVDAAAHGDQRGRM
jgi:hypothetical protein